MCDSIEIKGGAISEDGLQNGVEFDKNYEITHPIINDDSKIFIKNETALECDLEETPTRIKCELEDHAVSDASNEDVPYHPPELIICKSYTANETNASMDIKKERGWLETALKSEICTKPHVQLQINNKYTLNGEEEESSSLESARTCNDDIYISVGASLGEQKSIDSIDCEEETIINNTVYSNHSGKNCISTLENSSLIWEGKVMYRCTVCAKTYTRPTLLKNHYLITHEGKELHKCEICDKCFTHKSSLTAHYLLHEGKRPYKCEICGKSYTKMYHLKQHSLVHDGQKHDCEICGKSFTLKKILKNHIVTIHEGKEQLTCEICNKEFTHKYYLKKHSIIHEDKRLHQCDICGKGFNYKHCLQQHYSAHIGNREHKCKVCNKSFARKNCLQRHSLIHEGHRPFKCDVCNKDFAYKKCLKDHRLIHEGKKDYNCEVCNRSFRHKNVLKKHYETHNKKN